MAFTPITMFALKRQICFTPLFATQKQFIDFVSYYRYVKKGNLLKLVIFDESLNQEYTIISTKAELPLIVYASIFRI